MHARNRQQMAYLLIDILPLFPTANTEEMEDIQRALNQLNDGAAELRTFDTITLSWKYITGNLHFVTQCILSLLFPTDVNENDMGGPTREDAVQQMPRTLRLNNINSQAASGICIIR